jgi:hypothetical protein
MATTIPRHVQIMRCEANSRCVFMLLIPRVPLIQGTRSRRFA